MLEDLDLYRFDEFAAPIGVPQELETLALEEWVVGSLARGQL